MKDYELRYIDYACLKTAEKSKEFSTEKHITNALLKLLIGGYILGFTNNGRAR